MLENDTFKAGPVRVTAYPNCDVKGLLKYPFSSGAVDKILPIRMS